MTKWAALLLLCAACTDRALSPSVEYDLSFSKAFGDLAVTGASPQWAMLGNDAQHSNHAPYVGPYAATNATTYYTDGNSSAQPLIGGDGAVYVSFLGPSMYPSDQGPQLVALESNGALRWQSSPCAEIVGQPAMDANALYAPCDELTLVAVSASNGQPLWNVPLANNTLTAPTLTSDGNIAVGVDESLFVLDTSGNVLWTAIVDGEVRGTPAIDAQGTIYLGADANLYAFSATGVKLWQVSTSVLLIDSVVLADNLVLISSTDEVTLSAFDTSGKYAWSDNNSLGEPPSVGDGLILVPTTYGLDALDMTGSVIWSAPTAVAPLSALIDSTGHVFIVYGFGGSTLDVFDSTGKKLSTVPFISASSAPALGANGVLWFNGEGINALGP